MSDHSDSGPVLTLKVKDGLQQKDGRWVFSRTSSGPSLTETLNRKLSKNSSTLFGTLPACSSPGKS